MAKQTSGRTTRFTHGLNNGTAVCVECGRRTWRERIEDNGLCQTCFEAAGIDNEHEDGHHRGRPDPQCPRCEKGE